MMRSFPCLGVARVVVLAVALTVSVTACGGDTRPTYSQRAAQQLTADAARVRAAAEAHDVRAARAALNTLTRHVAEAQARGELPTDKARQILRAADWVAQDVAALPTPTPSPPPPPPEDDPWDRKEKEKEKKEEDDKDEHKGEEGEDEEKGKGERDKTGEYDKTGHGR